MECCSTRSETTPDLAMARHEIYGTLCRLLLAPTENLQNELESGALFGQLRECIDELGHCDELMGQVDTMESAWNDRPDLDPPDARTRYHRVFGHSLSPDYPPYETQYGTTQPFEQCERLADIIGIYRSFGLEVSPTLLDRADHLSVELEFMGFLAAKEAYHLERGEELHSQACRAGAKFFLDGHLGQAIVSFADRLTRLGPDGFYKEASRFASAYVRHDATQMGLAHRVTNPLELVPWDDAALAEAMAEEAQ